MFRNNQGQALIESMLLIPVFIFFLIYVIQAVLYLTVEIAVDDAMESYLLCEIQKHTNCRSRMSEHLRFLPLKKVAFQFSKKLNTYRIDLEATSLEIFDFKKQRQLQYDLEI